MLHPLALLRRKFWLDQSNCGSPTRTLCFSLLLCNSTADIIHPPHSPDLTPTSFSLSLQLKPSTTEGHFTTSMTPRWMWLPTRTQFLWTPSMTVLYNFQKSVKKFGAGILLWWKGKRPYFTRVCSYRPYQNFFIQPHRTFAFALRTAVTHDYYITPHRLYADRETCFVLVNKTMDTQANIQSWILEHSQIKYTFKAVPSPQNTVFNCEFLRHTVFFKPW